MLRLAGSLFAVLLSFSAQAGLIEIDGFNVGSEQMIALSGTDTYVVETNAVRTLSAELLAFSNPVQSSVEVSFGFLTISNGSAEDSEVRVSWGFDADLLPVGSSHYEFLIKVIESDGNATDLEFFYDGLSFANFDIPGNTLNQDVVFSISNSVLSHDGTLGLVINGDPGWDLQLDVIGLLYDSPIAHSVPEPSTIALFVLGLLGAGAARRRA
ncbi:PEP-CTERM sorting domain-containing protein [Neptunomonas japonica]|uniref:Ice-binding protein C-terminal domain-containing protein n=1 Tax=Neptunomonas japonica JAMM 1380 TaxID=1441457 RepID=A0A7R6PJE4_9GAMM|nr:PEP-CTERM sorting domain-containing protein [Neptunomonas japonica]BBB30698.1 hypothetical protein NEJAP_2755 [Neptunomonas japonica JAMM 1380]